MTGVERILALPPPVSIVVAVAISGSTKSKSVIRWALENFGRGKNVIFKLLHVHQPITVVPTPMGYYIPISQARGDVAAAYKQEIEWQKSEKLAPYLEMFARNKVQVDLLMLESDDVVNAIAGEVAVAFINKLVIGASSTSMFTRKRLSLSSRIAEFTPSSCAVYVVSKGKLSSVRPSDTETNGSIAENSSTMSFSSSGSSGRQDQSFTDQSFTDQSSVVSYSHSRSPSLPMQRFQALAMMNQTLLPVKANSFETDSSKCQSFDTKEDQDAVIYDPCNSDFGSVQREGFSDQTLTKYEQSYVSDQASSSDALREFLPNNEEDINLELAKLRIKLRHVQGMYAVAQNEKMDASRKLSDLSKRHSEEENKLKELHDQEEKAKEIAREEKQKYEAARREAETIRKHAEKEAVDRRNAEAKALHDAKEKEMLENALVNTANQYLKFTWEEIVAATLSFSEDLIIGRGANGTVYKGTLHSTISAVKVLHSNEGRGTKQFQQELEILSKIRHPHLLLLLGACTDHGCIVYEYMENGSLAARLQCQNDTPPIPWYVRFRIAWEIASALVFLHSTKPRPIIHRDLKPANILLDRNFVSKIGDVGLSTMLRKDPSYLTAMYTDTGPVGTLCYIDPEYQRTGVVSPKSDVYAYGMVVLQLLTGKQAMALAHTVEMALDDGNLTKILDPKAGMWPIEETKELAMLGLSCVEMRRKDRPDLKDQILPKLERLKDAACKLQDIAAPSTQLAPPNHFICPILKEIMEEPFVAADGFTYDRKGIEKWLQKNENSPKTNLPLPHKQLVPNFTLLSAITEWKSKR